MDSETTPLVSILVPARNEEKTIVRCVESILAQTYPNTEVLVIDDHSTDQTPQLLKQLQQRSSHFTILSGRPLPTGWKGKPNVLDQASAVAKGEWLLFVDADVELAPEALSSAMVAACELKADLFSLWPHQTTVTFWERTIQPAVVLMNVTLNSLMRLFSKPFPAALSVWGSFILTRSDAYRTVGGHAAVAGQIAEDHYLFTEFQKQAFRTFMFDGSHMLKVRMYDSLRAVWEGWSKNLFPGLHRSYLLTIAAVIAIMTVLISPYLLWLYWLWQSVIGQQVHVMFLLMSLALIMLAISGWLIQSHFSAAPWLAANPLGALIYAGTFLNSMVRHSFNFSVSWKGRRYQD